MVAEKVCLGSGIRKKPILDPGSRGQKVTGSGSATKTLIDMCGGLVALARSGRVGRPSAAPRTDALQAAKDFRGTTFTLISHVAADLCRGRILGRN